MCKLADALLLPIPLVILLLALTTCGDAVAPTPPQCPPEVQP